MSNNVDILHPELLSNEILLQILQERRVKIDGMENMARDRLLQMYHQFCLPLPQRKKDSHTCNSSKNSVEVNNNPLSRNTRKINQVTDSNEYVKLNKKFKTIKINQNKRKKSDDSEDDAVNNQANKKVRTRIMWP